MRPSMKRGYVIGQLTDEQRQAIRELRALRVDPHDIAVWLCLPCALGEESRSSPNNDSAESKVATASLAQQ